MKVAQLFRLLSPSSLAAGYIAVGVLALALFFIPLWYGWNINSATFRVYLEGEEVQGLVDVYGREGATGLSAAIEAKLATLPDDEVIVLADPSKKRLAGNLPAWPPEIPDSPGTFGLEISRGEQASMRMVVTHVRLPDGYHLLVGRASVMRFESLVAFFWYGIAGATAIILALGAVGWMTRRALLAEVQEISRTASAIAGGDLSRRVARHGRSDELDVLAETVNGMLEKLASQNTQLEREINVRKQGEDALQRARDQLQVHLDELLDLAPDAIVLTTLQQPRILRINREFTRMFGYAPEEAVGQRLRSLIVPEDVQPAGLADDPELRSGRKVERELVRRRKDGTHFHAHVTARRICLFGDDDAAYVIYRDITERKEADDRLRRSEAFLAEGQRISLTGSWGWNLSTGKEIWSDQRYRMLGFAPGEVEPSIDLALMVVHPEDRSRVSQVRKEAIRELRSYAIDYRIVLKDGSVRHMRSVGRPVVTGDGRVEEYIGITTDTTERVQAEAALRRAQRLEATGTLAGGIAHDFNNILGAILGYGEMAQRDAPEGSRLRRDLESIMTAGERGRALVDRILTFSRSGVGERVPVHVEKVLREALDLLMAKLPPNVTIKAELRAGRAAMRGDPTQIHQVVMNLATNGIQAMDAGGTLRISLGETRFDTQQIATIGTIAGGDYIVLKIADSGSGIPPGILERIFDPFFSTKEVGVGTGLGLSLVHGIVTEVGGAIDVETTPGAGSVFTVYLPHAGDAADLPTDEQPAMPRGDRQRVLVVDDEESLMSLTTRTLEELGYVPVGFTCGTAALEAFRADPKQFDAVITDERMPGISGSALIREIRGIRRTIPVLLVSGFVGGMVAGRAYNSGADEVLKKPLSAHELATSLARVLHLQ